MESLVSQVAQIKAPMLEENWSQLEPFYKFIDIYSDYFQVGLG